VHFIATYLCAMHKFRYPQVFPHSILLPLVGLMPLAEIKIHQHHSSCSISTYTDPQAEKNDNVTAQQCYE